MNKRLPDDLSIISVHEVAIDQSVVVKPESFFFGGKKRQPRRRKQVTFDLLLKLTSVNPYSQALNNLNVNFRLANKPFVVSFINAHGLTFVIPTMDSVQLF